MLDPMPLVAKLAVGGVLAGTIASCLGLFDRAAVWFDRIRDRVRWLLSLWPEPVDKLTFRAYLRWRLAAWICPEMAAERREAVRMLATAARALGEAASG